MSLEDAHVVGNPIERLRCAEVRLAAASRALDEAGFAVIATGPEQCIGGAKDGAAVDRGRLEKLSSSLARQ